MIQVLEHTGTRRGALLTLGLLFGLALVALAATGLSWRAGPSPETPAGPAEHTCGCGTDYHNDPHNCP